LAYRETGNVTTILLADDHAVVRQGLRALLEDDPDFTVVGEAASGDVSGIEVAHLAGSC
jgi:DNA-binding NarL/FixJ family response regulator